MRLTIIDFRELTLFIYFTYFYLETKIYLALWTGVLFLISAVIHLSYVDLSIYKVIMACCILILLVSYLYKFRDVIRSGQIIENVKTKNVSSDKRKVNRIGIASLLLIIVNIVAIAVIY